MRGSYSEKLARFVLFILIASIVIAVCWYLRSVIVYIILAALVAILSAPISRLICRIKIRGHSCPSWVGSIVSILTVFIIVFGVIITIVPLIRGVAQDISTANLNSMAQAVTVPLADFNHWIIRTFPKVGSGFKIEIAVLEQMQKIFDVSALSSVVGSVTSFIAKLGMTIFAVVFIAFFFIKNPRIMTEIVIALVPDKYEDRVRTSLHEIGGLVCRYFIGLTVEVFGVSLINFLGLLIIARMGFKYSIGIAFMTGILNIIPYFGPLIGGFIGVSLSLIIKYACVTSYGLSVGLMPFILILASIFIFTQLVDNAVFQPLIYSNSVKVHPLEIFIVFLIAGEVGGIVGMLVAIPAYTVLRVVAKEFLGNVKAVRMLTSTTSD